MSGVEAIEFMERLADMIDEEIRTVEFCDEFTWALNRFRYEVRKSVPVSPKKGTGRILCYSCGQCGSMVRPDTDKYCSKCGREIKW